MLAIATMRKSTASGCLFARMRIASLSISSSMLSTSSSCSITRKASVDVAPGKGLNGKIDLLFDQTAHLDNPTLQIIHVLVIGSDDMLGLLFDGHRNSP